MEAVRSSPAPHTLTTPIFSGNRHLSLALSDLVGSDRKQQQQQSLHYAGSDDDSRFCRDVDVPETMDYKKELARLLAKSRGTAYETTLKRFVEAKYKEIDNDMETRYRLTSRVDLMSLNSSKYDHARPSILDNSILNPEETRSRKLEELAKPLERLRYKSPTTPRARARWQPTNDMGRQRPAPSDPAPFSSSSRDLWDDSQSVGPRSPPTRQTTINEFQKWLRTNRDWKKRKESKITHIRKEQETELDKTAFRPKLYEKSVKLADIANMKVEQSLRSSMLGDENVSPVSPPPPPPAPAPVVPVIATTTYLEPTGAARSRFSTEEVISLPGRGSRKPSSNSAHPGDANSVTHEQAMEASYKLAAVQRAASMDMDPRASLLGSSTSNAQTADQSTMSVYDRLALRAKALEEKRRQLQESGRWSHNTSSPAISDYSRALAERKRSRDRRASSASPAISRDRSETPTDRRMYLLGSGISKVIADSPGAGKASTTLEQQATIDDEANGRSSRRQTYLKGVNMRLQDLMPPVTARDDAFSSPSVSPTGARGGSPDNRDRESTSGTVYSAKVMHDLAKLGVQRSVSASRARKEKTEQVVRRKQFVRSNSVSKPFQPMLVASETSRIMSRVNNTFEESTDRTARSIENYFVRHEVARRSASPGPGHYSNIYNVPVTSPNAALHAPPDIALASAIPTPRVAAETPTKRAFTRVSRSASPGARGYSFGKQDIGRGQDPRSPHRHGAEGAGKHSPGGTHAGGDHQKN